MKESTQVCYERVATIMPTYFEGNQEPYKKVAKAIYNNREIAFFYNKEELHRFQEKYKNVEITYE